MDAITIEWAGEKLTINENEAFEVGELIEEIVTLGELAEMGEKPRFFKLARCYSVMINFAGGNTTPKAVHSEMMKQVKGGGEQSTLLIGDAIAGLIAILMDGSVTDGDGEEAQADGKKNTDGS
tara:strand:- start:266 stop:634 length:369 start_codon:yes stop_codon:yes gene_type:complete